MTGDPAQFPVLLTSGNRNECFRSESMSLFERLKHNNVPTARLSKHYRMAPDIGRFTYSLFYLGGLQSPPDLGPRSTANLVRAVIGDSTANPSCLGNIYIYFFAHVESSIWRNKATGPITNPSCVNYIAHLVNLLVRKGVPEEQIIVFSDHVEKRRILRRSLAILHGYGGIEVKSINSAERMQKDVVILSTCRPGGRIDLGLTDHPKRQCLAMSHANDALIIVGDKNIGKFVPGYHSRL
ncbi:AAA domain-containing protein [Aspergillus pseudoustus]|uniref:AAA domain-containing protein n=1 Tax=Aspergillus pseudoustus TaxID=1810923 RepID=A0ABR4JY31_9EURO